MSKLWVVMGRAGDALAVLPLLYKDFQTTSQKQGMMLSKEFASVLDGCSYVESIVFDGDYHDLERAVVNARAVSDEVVVTSIHGSTDAVAKYAYSQIQASGRVTSSFQKEAWNLAGVLHRWDECLPLVFDKRCTERETVILEANGFKKSNKKPVLLLAVDGGQTAPFPHAQLLKQLVHSKFGKQYRIIDLPMVEKPHGRVYDLLAVMERSALLITSDSMPLHLAWACRILPVFALTNDRDAQGNPSLWHGSPWRPNHLWYCRYSDWPARAVEMCEAINNLKPRGPAVYVDVVVSALSVAVADYSGVIVGPGMCREKSGAPLLKDAIRLGLQRCGLIEEQHREQRERDVDLNMRLYRMGVRCLTFFLEPCYAYRIKDGQHSPIVDLFSAPKSFWKTILPEIPDLLLDNDCVFWSQALWAIFKRHGAVDASGCVEFVGEAK